MKHFFFLLSTFLFLPAAFSQTQTKDTLTDTQVNNAIALYDQYTKDNAPIYNGSEYLFYTFKMEGDPFFGSGIYGDGAVNFVEGWVSYNGRKYGLVPLLFDLVRDQLVVLSPDHKTPVVMLNEFIDSFSLYGHKFIALKEDHKQNLYNTGFYDLLYDGQHVQFLERHVKSLNPRIQGTSLTTFFQSKNHFYIHKNGLYYLVTGRKDVYRVFGDNVHEVKKMMRQNHLKLGHKNFETAAAKATAFYDQLTH